MKHVSTLTALFVVAVLGCSSESAPALSSGGVAVQSVEAPLWITSKPGYSTRGWWPSGTVPTCLRNTGNADPTWNSTTFQQFASAAQTVIEAEFEHIPGADIDFTGWGACPATTPNGTLAININNVATGVATDFAGYDAGSPNTAHFGTIGKSFGANWDTYVLHEMAHVLGFSHEYERLDSGLVHTAWLTCIAGTPPGTWGGMLFTVHDPDSISSGTYCHLNGKLSELDRLGLEIGYNDGSGPRIRMAGGLGGFVPRNYSPTFYLDWLDRGAHSDAVPTHGWVTSGQVNDTSSAYPYNGVATSLLGNYTVTSNVTDVLGNQYQDAVAYSVSDSKFAAMVVTLL